MHSRVLYRNLEIERLNPLKGMQMLCSELMYSERRIGDDVVNFVKSNEKMG